MQSTAAQKRTRPNMAPCRHVVLDRGHSWGHTSWAKGVTSLMLRGPHSLAAQSYVTLFELWAQGLMCDGLLLQVSSMCGHPRAQKHAGERPPCKDSICAEHRQPNNSRHRYKHPLGLGVWAQRRLQCAACTPHAASALQAHHVHCCETKQPGGICTHIIAAVTARPNLCQRQLGSGLMGTACQHGDHVMGHCRDQILLPTVRAA
jgi:hypothetical protein